MEQRFLQLRGRLENLKRLQHLNDILNDNEIEESIETEAESIKDFLKTAKKEFGVNFTSLMSNIDS